MWPKQTPDPEGVTLAWAVSASSSHSNSHSFRVTLRLTRSGRWLATMISLQNKGVTDRSEGIAGGRVGWTKEKGISRKEEGERDTKEK